MIQNADDNRYDAENCIPTLTLSYRHGLLRTDCNELGFTKEDVAAICNAGASYKARKQGYTGKKGVGFKSVFSVAATVWIASGAYTFKFQRAETLGMVVPIWDDNLPEAPLPDHTSMFLQLSHNIDVRDMLRGLRSQSYKVLIFVRRLRQIILNIERTDQSQVISYVNRTDSALEDGFHMTVITRTNRPRMRFIVSKHHVQGALHDKEQLAEPQNTLQLAFPIDDAGEPILEAQQVYSFLPIRSYGFTVGDIS